MAGIQSLTSQQLMMMGPTQLIRSLRVHSNAFLIGVGTSLENPWLGLFFLGRL